MQASTGWYVSKVYVNRFFTLTALLRSKTIACRFGYHTSANLGWVTERAYLSSYVLRVFPASGGQTASRCCGFREPNAS